VGDRVFVKAMEAENRSVGGILLPASSQGKSNQGEVTAAGSTKGVKVGDKIIYSKYAGTEIELQGTSHMLLKEDDVIGLMPGSDVSQLQPLQDRVLIQVMEADDTTSGGLLLTEGAKEKPNIGKVVAVGPGKEVEDGEKIVPGVAVGDTVLYSKYSGTEFQGGDKEYIVVRDADIMATLA
jgi:chaperonin GroES